MTRIAPIACSRPTKIALLVALMAAHVGLAFWYAAVTPYRTAGILLSYRRAPAADIGAPDERQHANYIARLVRGQGLPVFNPTDPNLYESYQSHQPPLYYALGAAWFRLLGGTDPTAADQGFRLRSLNALLGAGTVAGVFLFALWGYRRSDVAIVAAAFAALLPMNVALSGAMSNDVLLILLCTWTLAFLAAAVRSGWSRGRAVGVGVAIGLGFLTKTTAVALVPVLLLAFALRRPRWTEAAMAAGLPLLLALPWWARNQALYGDPLAIRAFGSAFGGSAQAEPFVRAFGLGGYLIDWVGWWTARSFFGVFGYMDVWLNETGTAMGAGPNSLYRLLIAGTAVLSFGWIAAALRPEQRPARPVLALGLVFFFFLLALFLRFNLQYFQGQARYLLPAIGPIASGFALGGIHLSRGRWAPVLAAFVLVFGGLAVWTGDRLPEEFARRMAAGGPS